MNRATILSVASNILRCREVRFAVIQVTTRCNARCLDRCNIWSQLPVEMKLEDVQFTLDVLSKNHFSVAYFTGGETGLYPSIVQAVQYAKGKGFITSLTSNGTIPKQVLSQLGNNLDTLSISVDHYNEETWDRAKSHFGIHQKAKETIQAAKDLGISTYAVTFLNPAWTTKDVERVVRYVNDELGIPFALSYPFISSNNGTYVVGGKLCDGGDYIGSMRGLVLKVLEMKLSGSKVATTTGYLHEVIRAHDNLPLKYPCKAGRTILAVDCKLNVFACYKKKMLFNLKDCQNLNLQEVDSSSCDNKNCMINCFKEASQAARENSIRASMEELLSNPQFYFGVLRR